MKDELMKRFIPNDKMKAVENALHNTFSTTHVDEMRPLTDGYSGALVYQISVNGSNYLLRITTQVNELTDPCRQFKCLNLAAASGIAPRVYYTDVANALSITEFIVAQPMDKLFEVLRQPARFAALVKSIHALPLFPPLVNFLDGVDQLIAQFKSFQMFPETLISEAFSLYGYILNVYPRDQDLVSSHNDLNPNNLLFDGQKIWVVDWEASFCNDRYVDLSIAAQTYSASPEKVTLFLEAYFGDQLDEYKQARFFIMQQICLMYYAMLMFQVGYQQAPIGYQFNQSFDMPHLADFRAMLKKGGLSLGDFETKVQYGKVMFKTMWQNMLSSQFRESIQIFKNQN